MPDLAPSRARKSPRKAAPEPTALAYTRVLSAPKRSTRWGTRADRFFATSGAAEAYESSSRPPSEPSCGVTTIIGVGGAHSPRRISFAGPTRSSRSNDATVPGPDCAWSLRWMSSGGGCADAFVGRST